MAEASPRSAHPWGLHALLLLLLLLSGAALVALIVAPATPPAPQPFALPARALPALQAIAALPPLRRRDIHTAPGHRYRWLRQANGRSPSIELELLPVRLRRFQDLGVTPIQRLRQRPLWRDSDVTYILDGADQLALVHLRQQQSLQSCWVRGKQAAAQSETLSPGVEALVDLLDRQPPDLGSRLRVVLGLEPPRRWECILVSLTSPAGKHAEAQLRAAWRELRPLLP